MHPIDLDIFRKIREPDVTDSLRLVSGFPYKFVPTVISCKIFFCVLSALKKPPMLHSFMLRVLRR